MNEELFDLSELDLSEEELFSRVDNSLANSEKITAPRYSYWKSVFRVFFKKKINIIILVLLAIVIIFTYIYPLLSNYNRYEFLLDNNAKHLYPWDAMNYHNDYSLKWIFGSGSSGESTFDALWDGARVSLTLALICAAINITIGVILGALWGFSKRVDIIMTEIYNIIANVPYILYISVFVLIFSSGFWPFVLALTLTGWLSIAYFIRTQVIIIRDREYNLASRCLGTPILRLTTKNILPYLTSIIVTLIATEIPSYISYEAFLSYLGLGLSGGINGDTTKGITSLGNMISQAQSAMVTPGWEFEFWAPVLVASFVTIVLYVVGQNLGDASDPRTHM